VFSDHSGAGAILLSGGAVKVAGGLYVSGDETCVTLEGNPYVVGTSDPAKVLENVHHNVMAPDFPELDTAPLAALATNVVDSSTDTETSGQVFSNIRIAAGTNPTFAANTQINGVVYVEAPNIVSFEGHATVNGFIVTEDSDAGMDACQIYFAGTVDATGVDALPDTPEFADVKAHTGTFLLAPGFKVTFTGDFATINGTIAADQFLFSGTATGVIKGAVIGLEDLPTVLDGNVQVTVDRSGLDPDPAGFIKSLSPEVDYNTYREPVTGG
ncbi:MAG: hypothetical protein ACYS5V_13545, partial [Planctomycetota bacterium]